MCSQWPHSFWWCVGQTMGANSVVRFHRNTQYSSAPGQYNGSIQMKRLEYIEYWLMWASSVCF